MKKHLLLKITEVLSQNMTYLKNSLLKRSTILLPNVTDISLEPVTEPTLRTNYHDY